MAEAPELTPEQKEKILSDVEKYYNALDAFIDNEIFKNDTEEVNTKAFSGAVALLLCKSSIIAGYSKEQLVSMVEKSYDLVMATLAVERLATYVKEQEQPKEEPNGDAL